jgi:hypothetical protein
LPFLEWLDNRLAQAIATLHAEEGNSSGSSYPNLIQPSSERIINWLNQAPGVSPFQKQNEITVEQLTLLPQPGLDRQLQPVCTLIPPMDKGFSRMNRVCSLWSRSTGRQNTL